MTALLGCAAVGLGVLLFALEAVRAGVARLRR